MYTQKGQKMPPKKKDAVKAPVKKAPAKRPVGRPRKPLGTRVSDVDPLANVGSTKPMPRRIGRDALEQQRARLRFARDYPGQRFTEQMTRALQDSFSTGMLPYGVSLRAPEPFARKYKTSFAPIAGMPVWPAYNPGSAPPGTGRATRRSIATGPGPGSAPPGPSKRMILERLEELLDDEDEGTERTRMRLAAVPNARQISRRSAAAIKKELDELARTGKTAATREAIMPSLGSTTSSASSTSSAPGRLREDQLKKMEAAMSRLVQKAAEAEALRPSLGSTTSSSSSTSVAPRSSSASSTSSAPSRLSDAQINKLQAAMNRLVQQADAGAPPQRPQQPATREWTDAERRRIERLQQRIAVNNSILAQPMPIHLTGGYDVLRQEIRDAEAELRDMLQARNAPPPMTQAEAENAVARAADINDRIDQIDEALATQPGRGMANLLGMQRRTLENDRASIIDPGPPPQSVMVGVPDPVQEDEYLNNLRQAEQEEEKRLTRVRAGRSIAEAQLNLAHLRGLIRDRLAERSRFTPSSEPVLSAQESVQQSIPVPGTETQVPLSAVQSLMEVQGRLIDRLDHERRLATAPSPAILDLRYDPATGQHYSRDIPFETPRGRQALEVRPSQKGSDIDREQAELQVPRNRMDTLLQAIAAKITPDLIKEEKIRFARMAEEAAKGNKLIAQSEAARLKGAKGPPVNDLRAAARLAFMPPATARRLNEEADRRVGKAPAVVQDTAEPAPGLATGISDLELETSALQRAARSPDSLPGTIALLNAELVRRGEDERDVRTALGLPPLQGPSPADTVVIPVPSNTPEPQSELAIQNPTVNGNGLQHVTAATFPSGKWTTASSLRWLRSNGLHPIRKSTKINGAYSYALQSPAGYSSFNSVKMSHKNKDFTIVYGTPK